MRRESVLGIAVVLCVLTVANITSATIIRGIEMDFVTIGNAGNAADTTYYGAVGYNYRIGKYEVTNAQWNAFIAAAGAPTNGGRGNESAYYTGDQQPTNNVSWYEALQFCNYLTSGDKSKGVYQFTGDNTNPGDFISINRTAAQATTYDTIYFLPTMDEWYKAAYYKPDGSGYSLYTNGLDTIPAADNGWNYDGGTWYWPWDVGTGTQEQNGTFDMIGNVWEWNETMVGYSSYGPLYGLHGGSFNSSGIYITSSFFMSYYPHNEERHFGFRIASIPVPAIHNGTQDIYYATIQDAVDDANEGDTIVVPVGTYSGHGNRDIDLQGKAVTVRSENPNDPAIVAGTIIDCRGTAAEPHRGFYFHSGEDVNSILDGFTITNGYGPHEPFSEDEYSAGGAIYCENSSPTIRNCVFANNYSGYWGGGLWFGNSRAAVEKCTFRENNAPYIGGGLYNRVSTIMVSNCLFTDNSSDAGGGIYNIDGTSTIKNTLFVGNSAAISGGGLRNKRVTSTIANCTFFANQAPSGGAIHNILSNGTTITNCILWRNPDSEIEGDAEVTYCDVKGGWPGEGNIDADPCFADSSEGDFHLRSEYGRWDPTGQTWVIDAVTSLCIDAGSPNDSVRDEPSPNGNRINLGVYGGTEEASKSPGCAGHLLSDLNRDCRVDFFDFAIFVNQWLECNFEEPELCW